MPLHLRWEDSLKDRWTWIVGAAILVLPTLLVTWLLVSSARLSQANLAERAAVSILSELDILLDHINGRLIGLQLSRRDCSEDHRRHMHRAAYILPGVEAFLMADDQGQFYCSSWEPVQPVQPIVGLNRGLGLHLSLERWIPVIKQRGILIYRWGADGHATLAVLSWAAVRQLLDRAQFPGDTVFISHTGQPVPIAINGLLSPDQRLRVNAVEPSRTDARHARLDDAFRLVRVRSVNHSELSVGYLYQPRTLAQVVRADYGIVAAVFLLGIALALAWVSLRRHWLEQIEHQIQLGFKHNEFEAWFQPIVDLRTGHWVGAEALARWIRAGQAWVSPLEFIPAAEDSGQIRELTRRITVQSCQLAERIAERHPDFYVSINTSPNYLDEEVLSFAEQIQHRFSSLSARNLRVEMTETGLDSDRRRQVQATLEGLDRLGCELGIDDFGTGQAGLDYLSDLPFHFLKLDRRFVQAIHTDSIDFRLLESIIRLAHSLELTLIAEGVETEEQAQWLRLQGIHYAQGWLYSPALPAHVFSETFLRQREPEGSPVTAFAP